MMATAIRTIERDEWMRLAPSFKDYNYRQLWDFGVACANRVGAISEHITVADKDRIIGLADVRIKAFPLLGNGIAYINGGPLVRSGNEGDPEIWKTVLTELIAEYVDQRGYVLRIQPSFDSETGRIRQKEVFEGLGFVRGDGLKTYRTMVLDLSMPLEVIRKQFDQKWRNGLNGSEKRGLTVKVGTEDSYFADFLRLFEGMMSRKEFDVDLVPEFYRQVQSRMVGKDQFRISLVCENDQPITGHVASLLGDTCVYLLGASNEAGLKNKASYLVQWSVIRMAKEQGCHYYDLGGIDPGANPGVYHFKKGLGGADVTLPGPFERYPGPWSKCVVSMTEKLYRRLKKIRRFI